MRKVIQQSVVLPARPEALFAMYFDAAAHSVITGFPVTIGADADADFRAFDGQLSGTILSIVRSTLIVQSWRSTKFHDDDPDSTLVLMFMPEPETAGHGRIDLAHLDVPDHDFQDVTEGWSKYYWSPWRTYLDSHNA
jgi:activator of HSP90 ATPase